MGKKNKDKGSFDGKNAYDYLSREFNKTYRPHRSDRESSDVYNRKRDRDFQRYMMTGEKSSGRGKYVDDITGQFDKEDKSIERKLFAAGIPPSQWKYYAQKAGITNVNSKSDAKDIISVYNADERYQGPDTPAPSQPAQDFKDKYVDKVIENTVPKPEFVPQQSIGDVTGGNNSIVSPISQDNDISITGDSNTVNQDNSIEQMMKNMRQSLRFAY